LNFLSAATALICVPAHTAPAGIWHNQPDEAIRLVPGTPGSAAGGYGVARPRVFGSAARGDDHEGSDLDLLVEPAPTTTLFTLVALQIEAERLLGVSVDVLTPRSLPRGSRERILREAVPV
jgi:uncharacterized protein